MNLFEAFKRTLSEDPRYNNQAVEVLSKILKYSNPVSFGLDNVFQDHLKTNDLWAVVQLILDKVRDLNKRLEESSLFSPEVMREFMEPLLKDAMLVTSLASQQHEVSEMKLDIGMQTAEATRELAVAVGLIAVTDGVLGRAQAAAGIIRLGTVVRAIALLRNAQGVSGVARTAAFAAAVSVALTIGGQEVIIP